jgi:hypothetical protein
MKDQDVLEILTQIFPFVGSQNAQRQTDQGPQVYDGIVAAIMFTQFMNLCMTIVASRDAVIGSGSLDLLIFQLAVSQALFLVTGLEKAAATATAVIVGPVGCHVHEIFFSHHGFNDIAQIFGNGVAIAFADDLTGVLNRKFDFEILVPVGVDVQFSFPDPFCVVLINVFDDKFVCDVEFFQSCQD